MHVESDLILRLLQIVTGNGYLGGGHPVGFVNPNQLCERLRNLRAAGE
jgi:hypothetical protein